eukprot:scaffold33588_cov76-Amphora_coffeaeformis.AAC.2
MASAKRLEWSKKRYNPGRTKIGPDAAKTNVFRGPNQSQGNGTGVWSETSWGFTELSRIRYHNHTAI